MNQAFSSIFYNVRNDVTMDGTDQLVPIQRAIDAFVGDARNPSHLLFPPGVYAFKGTLRFVNDNQQVEFLSGAILKPLTPDSFVQIGRRDRVVATDGTASFLVSGSNQIFRGMRIEEDAVEGDDKGAPALLYIYRAANLHLECLRVQTLSSSRKCLVRVEALTKCVFEAASLIGIGAAGSTGLRIGAALEPQSTGRISTNNKMEPATEIVSTAMTIRGFDTAVRIATITENTTFTGSSFLESGTTAFRVEGVADNAYVAAAYNFGLFGCQFDGADHFIEIAAGSYLWGGAISGCWFGAFNPAAISADIRSIFRVNGTVSGLAVRGCSHSPVPEENSVVWLLDLASAVDRSGARFNAWAGTPLVSGGVESLTSSTSEDGTLTEGADSIHYLVDQVGFFGDGPTTPQTYRFSDTRISLRNLRLDDPKAVLRSLLQDLHRLGLIKK